MPSSSQDGCFRERTLACWMMLDVVFMLFWAVVSALLVGFTVTYSLGGAPVGVWISTLPLLYVAWLIGFLAGCVIETQNRWWLFHFQKVRRVSNHDHDLTYYLTLSQYFRARIIWSLPLVDALQLVCGFRWLAFRSYSDRAFLGNGSILLGRIFDPDLTHIGDGAIVGSCSAIVSHSFIRNPDGTATIVTAPIKIGNRAVIGGGATVELGAEIGDDSIVEFASRVSAFTKIGPGEVWGGSPAKFLRTRRDDVSGEDVGVNSEGQCNSTGAAEFDARVSSEQLELRELLDESSESTLRRIVAKALHVDPTSLPDQLSAAQNSEWDSLAQLEIILGLNLEFGVELAPQVSQSLNSLPALRNVIRRHQLA